jgi:hypothetical protein
MVRRLRRATEISTIDELKVDAEVYTWVLDGAERSASRTTD